jgi:hypothetical protein
MRRGCLLGRPQLRLGGLDRLARKGRVGVESKQGK